MIRDIIRTTILTVVIVVLRQLVSLLEIEIPFGEQFYPILIFFFFQSLAILLLVQLGQTKLEIPIHMLAIAAMTIRLISALMAVVIFVLVGVDDMTNFIITFFTVYLFYFVFEIITVLSNLRSNLK